jgi:serine/threonine protein kinase
VYLASVGGENGRLVAVKCLDMKSLVGAAQHEYVNREVVALQSLRHQFVAEFYSVIMSPRKIMFVLEYAPGGDLWSHLYDKQRDPATHGPYGGLSLKTVGNYAAIVTIALEYIHNESFCYRDLKPENIIIAQNGYVKLVDFGLSKVIPFLSKTEALQYRTYTLCGSPEYMAP